MNQDMEDFQPKIHHKPPGKEQWGSGFYYIKNKIAAEAAYKNHICIKKSNFNI